ncbi:YkgJ family cysteine cluster protein [Pelovirga terrestris]|uniref:YkgJ family cysteine cluster protein n=1 Tax=Pelovirga terrestris TaxID=2771352 RepID=A0A8J6UL93_9BACT|nr:YkgJ family cysteine cluster protein [Pelovirga terrestris]MBD1400832.1 YkgJ family cysteine cluster protein [Pelovirga terrestris]
MDESRLPPQVVAARQQLDDAIAELWQSWREQERDLYCRAGCGNCCTLAVNCSYPEAVMLAAGLSVEQRQQINERLPVVAQLCTTAADLKEFLHSYRQQGGGCPLLDPQQNCSSYHQRPLSCRALLSTRPPAWCGVDFSALHPHEKQAFLSSLDQNLVAFPSHYLARPLDLAAELEKNLRNEFAHEYGVNISGNLIWLLGLELNSQVGERLAKKEEGLVEWLLEQQERYPYLLQVTATL